MIVSTLDMIFKKKNSTAHIRFEPSGRDLPIYKEVSVLEVALKNNVDIDNSCGGSGSCGTCRVFIKSGNEKLGPRNDIEQAMAEDRGFIETERLACQIEPKNGLIVEVPTPKLGLDL